MEQQWNDPEGIQKRKSARVTFTTTNRTLMLGVVMRDES